MVCAVPEQLSQISWDESRAGCPGLGAGTCVWIAEVASMPRAAGPPTLNSHGDCSAVAPENAFALCGVPSGQGFAGCGKGWVCHPPGLGPCTSAQWSNSLAQQLVVSAGGPASGDAQALLHAAPRVVEAEICCMKTHVQ